MCKGGLGGNGGSAFWYGSDGGAMRTKETESARVGNLNTHAPDQVLPAPEV